MRAFLLILLTALLLTACNSRSAPDRLPPSDAEYPLKLAAGKRYLVDHNNQPFLIHGDTAWSLIAQLSKEDAERYLEDRRQKGFNTILVNLIEAKFTDNAPKNYYGDDPFTEPGDFTTPNEKYFAHADWVIKKAAQKGILVMLTPAYLGWDGNEQGWYQTMKANGVSKLREYGRYLGKRYKDFKNILWVQGGDYSPPAEGIALVRAVAEGIEEFDKVHLHTGHGGQDGAMEAFPGEAWLDVNNVYTYNTVYLEALKEYNRSNAKPFFLMESTYEGEHKASQGLIRAQAYQALLSGATGHLFGNNPIWYFDGPGLFPAPTTWEVALNGRGSQDMAHLWRLFGDLAWEKLVPDQNDTFLTGGAGPEGNDHALAARAEDGSFALVYVPSSRTIKLDLTKLKGSKVRAQWYDPTAGRFVTIVGSPFDRTSAKSLSTPGKNSTGTGDWVLLLEAEQP